MNDFVERMIMDIMQKTSILGKRLSEAEEITKELKSNYNELLRKFETLQKNYDELLSLVLEK